MGGNRFGLWKGWQEREGSERGLEKGWKESGRSAWEKGGRGENIIHT